MPRLTCAALALAIGLVAPAARADDGPRWSLDARVGYATAWNTGQSYLGPGTGLALGVTFRVPIHLEIGAVYHAGSTVSAANDALVYWSRQWAVLAHAGVGYDVNLLARRLLLRPRVLFGGAFTSDTVQIGSDTRHTLDPTFTLGLGVDVLARFGGVHAGLDARALFVPSEVTAPIGGLYAVFGFER
jgi:hypothetical protein